MINIWMLKNLWKSDLSYYTRLDFSTSRCWSSVNMKFSKSTRNNVFYWIPMSLRHAHLRSRITHLTHGIISSLVLREINFFDINFFSKVKMRFSKTVRNVVFYWIPMSLSNMILGDFFQKKIPTGTILTLLL